MNEKDPKKTPEEELQELLEKLKEEDSQDSKNTAIIFGFLLHRNYFIHMILSTIVNFLMSAAVLGIAIGVQYPLVESLDVLSFVLAILLLTLIENFIKILMFRYFMRAMLLSMGTISVLIQILILVLISLYFVEGFRFIGTIQLIVFSVGFTIFRFILSVYLRRWLYLKPIKLFGGKQ